jgi:type III secretion protein J
VVFWKCVRVLASLLLVAAWAGCSAEIEHGLDERQANQIAALLDEHGVEAEKTRDDGSEAWKILVPRAELARSFELLESYDLPRRDRRGMQETLADHGLVPSMGEDQARLEAARAAELERTLERVPGVVSARVHLAFADPTQLDGHAAPPRASVLLRTDGRAAISDREVRTLVAFATSGLQPESVNVVMTAGRAADGNPLEPVGPLRVAHGERGRVVAIAASGLALLILLGAALLFTALRLTSLRSRTVDSGSPRA